MEILHNMIFIPLFKGKLKERDQKMRKNLTGGVDMKELFTK